MKRFSLFVIALALCVGAAETLRRSGRQEASFRVDGNAAHATNAAFRDGLFLGGLAAKRGSEPHIAIGRWATDEDRSSFAAGYQQGYAEFLAGRITTVNSLRQSE